MKTFFSFWGLCFCLVFFGGGWSVFFVLWRATLLSLLLIFDCMEENNSTYLPRRGGEGVWGEYSERGKGGGRLHRAL